MVRVGPVRNREVPVRRTPTQTDLNGMVSRFIADISPNERYSARLLGLVPPSRDVQALLWRDAMAREDSVVHLNSYMEAFADAMGHMFAADEVALDVIDKRDYEQVAMEYKDRFFFFGLSVIGILLEDEVLVAK